MNFNPNEVATMLQDYKEDKGLERSIKGIAEQIYYYTSGYPYLVNKLCQIIDEKILPGENKKKWLEKNVEEAVNIILNISSVNFDSLIKNLENNKRLYDFMESIIYDGKKVKYNKNGLVKVHNKIYRNWYKKTTVACLGGGLLIYIAISG